MKKNLLAFIFIAFVAGAISAQQLELKEVITRSARGIEGELPQNAKIVLLNFESPAKAFSDYVIDELSGELIEGKKITVVDRRNLSVIMDEMKFQYSGYVSDESMQSIGKMLGAQAVISGSLTDVGANYRFRIRVISVETAAVLRQISLDLKKDSQVAYFMGDAQAVQEAKKEQQRIARSNEPKAANARNNWGSAEVSGGYNSGHEGGFALSIGARYERMLSPYVSLGADFYYVILIPLGLAYYQDELDSVNIDTGSVFGIDAAIRFYPMGRKLFFGIGLGYYDNGNTLGNWWGGYSPTGKYVMEAYNITHGYGFAITPELGWKIDVGKEGGFFIEPGFLATFIIGMRKIDPQYNYSVGINSLLDDDVRSVLEDERHKLFINGHLKFYLGAGWAF